MRPARLCAGRMSVMVALQHDVPSAFFSYTHDDDSIHNPTRLPVSKRSLDGERSVLRHQRIGR